MKTCRTPALLFATLYLLFLACLWISSSTLPERVATHFDFAGNPNGWMSRRGWLAFSLIFGALFPLSFVAILWSLRFFPRSLNLPHRERWLAPEHREETFAYLLRQSFWLACLSIVFVAGIHAMVLEANQPAPGQLHSSFILILAAAFLSAMAVWGFRLWRYFSNPPPASQPPGR